MAKPTGTLLLSMIWKQQNTASILVKKSKQRAVFFFETTDGERVDISKVINALLGVRMVAGSLLLPKGKDVEKKIVSSLLKCIGDIFRLSVPCQMLINQCRLVAGLQVIA